MKLKERKVLITLADSLVYALEAMEDQGYGGTEYYRGWENATDQVLGCLKNRLNI